MPIYEYQCTECENKFERFVRSMNAQEEIMCPQCGSTKVEKAFSVFGVGGSSNGSGSSAASCAPSGGG